MLKDQNVENMRNPEYTIGKRKKKKDAKPIKTETSGCLLKEVWG